MEKIKTGITGFGRVAGNHFRAMGECGLYDVASVISGSHDARQQKRRG